MDTNIADISMADRLEKLEKRIKKLESRVNTIDKERDELADNVVELEERLSELEDDHISLLLYMCVCNTDGGDNGSCESYMHYCLCEKLSKRTFDCRSKNGHNCICRFDDNGESSKTVEWCRAHKSSLDFNEDDLVEVDLNDDSGSGSSSTAVPTSYRILSNSVLVGGKVHKLIKDYNPRRYMKHFVSRIKKEKSWRG